MQEYLKGTCSKSRFIVTIVACCVILIPGGGICYGFSSISPYLLSYSYHHNNGTAGVASQAVIYACYMSGHSLGMIVAGFLETRLPFPWITVPSVVLFDVSLLLARFSVKHVATLCVTYGMLGTTLGMLYSACFMAGLSWVKKEHYGKFSGILCSGYGLASLFISPLQTLYINPHNVKPTPVSGLHNKVYVFTQNEILEKVPWLFVIYGVMSACLQIPLAFLIRKDKTSSDGSSGNLTTFFDKLKFVITKSEFWIIFVIFGLNKIPLAYTATYSKIYGELFIVNDMFLSTVIGMAGLFNATGRPFWGFVKDRLETRNTVILMCLMTSVFILTWFISRYIPVIFLSDIMFTVGVWGSFFTCCGNYAVFPATIARFFGDEYFGVAYGVLYVSQGLGSFLSAGVTEYVPIWVPLAVTIAVICVISGLFGIALGKQSHDKISEETAGLIEMKGSSTESVEE